MASRTRPAKKTARKITKKAAAKKLAPARKFARADPVLTEIIRHGVLAVGRRFRGMAGGAG